MQDTSGLFAAAYVASQVYHKWLDPKWVEDNVKDDPVVPRSETDWMSAFLLLQHLLSKKRDPRWDLESLVAEGQAHMQSLRGLGGVFVSYGDKWFPNELKYIPDPPLGLNICGHVEWLFHADKVAVIGSRRANRVAMKMSFELGKKLAGDGVLVVSGGAYGCDVAAHKGALAACAAPTPTVAVFAGGLDMLTPVGNRFVFDEIALGGGILLSERLCGVECKPYDFPVRNRIIAGLSSHIFVMQAQVRSGAMITARQALDFGREVLVLDHGESEIAQGSRSLIEEGAEGFLDFDFIL